MALHDQDFVKNSIEQNFEEMKRYEQEAEKYGIKVIDSYTNFITYFFDSGKSSKEIADTLLKRGVIVRDLTSYELNGIRITIGNKTQNDIFFEEFRKVYP